MKENNEIPVVLITDNSQVMPCAVVLYSILQNAKTTTNFNFYIFSKPALPKDLQKKLLQTIAKFKNAKLEFVVVEEDWSNVKKTHSYVTIESAYKMLIPKYLQQYDKVLYLDTDVLVRSDITELYNFDMEDNYLAGCVDMNYQTVNAARAKSAAGMEDLSFYINAGVMLMNLKSIRKDGIDKKCISLLGTCEGSVDQHIFNKVCYGRIAFLPYKFNVFGKFTNEQYNIFYSYKEIHDAIENPAIFHWAGALKPWLYYNVPLAHEWFRYYLKTVFGKDLLKREKFCGTTIRIKKYLFNLIVKISEGNKRTLDIFGIKFTYKKGK